MKLLVMCPRFPYPLEKGDKLRMYHQIRFLADEHDIVLVSITEKEVPLAHIDILKKYVKEVHIYKISKPSRALSLTKSLVTSLPFQVSYYYNARVARKINQLIHHVKPDHIYCQLTRMSEYAKSAVTPTTLDYMDAFGVGMARRAEVVSGLYAAIYRHEAKRMKKYEKQIYAHFDNHVIISAQDAEQVSHLPISVVPNGIDTDYFVPMQTDLRYDIGFVGNMGYAPNIDAAEYLVRKVLPLLDSSTKMVIAGARPDRRVKQLASSNVTITGWLDDVRMAYASSKVFVAPLWLGTGQQNKILEAMAMGIPCITSAAVNNAIGAEIDKEILVAENEKEFVHLIRKLTEDKAYYDDISKNARTFVVQNYSWKQSVDLLKNIFKQ